MARKWRGQGDVDNLMRWRVASDPPSPTTPTVFVFATPWSKFCTPYGLCDFLIFRREKFEAMRGFGAWGLRGLLYERYG